MQPQDWYGVSRKEIDKIVGKAEFRQFPSVEALIRRVYPEANWDSSRFVDQARTPPMFLLDIQSITEQLERFGTACGVNNVSGPSNRQSIVNNSTQLEDWYKIRTKDVTLKDAKNIFGGGSVPLEEALRVVYPHYAWNDSRFDSTRIPHGFWNDPANHKSFLDDIGFRIGVKQVCSACEPCCQPPTLKIF